MAPVSMAIHQMKIISVPEVVRPIHQIPLAVDGMEQAVIPQIPGEIPHDPFRCRIHEAQEIQIAAHPVITQQLDGPLQGKVGNLLHVMAGSHRQQPRANLFRQEGKVLQRFPVHPQVAGQIGMGMGDDGIVAQILSFFTGRAVHIILLCAVPDPVGANRPDGIKPGIGGFKPAGVLRVGIVADNSFY
ncbi:hypothetical protein D3C75_928780 [compost metagenome]